MSNNFGLRENDISIICNILSQYPQVLQALIFGSRAKGNYRQGSDVDIAIKGKDITSKIVNQISFILNEETTMPYHFDILHYENIKEPELLQHIDRVGKIFYEKDKYLNKNCLL